MSEPATDRVAVSPGNPPVVTGLAGATPMIASVSWGAILVGAVVAITFGAMLNVLGAALGASAIDTTARDTPGASTFTFGTGLWLAVSASIGLLLGGIVASRLGGTWERADALLHGLGVWAVTFLIAILVIGGTVSSTTLSAIRGTAGIASGAATAIASATAGAAAAGGAAIAAGQNNDARIAAMLQRRLAAPADPAAMSPEQAMTEFGDLIARRLAEGGWQPADRQRAEQLVASVANISPAEARARLEQAEAEIDERTKQAVEAARRAADATAAAVALAAFWAFATMLIGLGAATMGAWLGAREDKPVVAAVVARAYPGTRHA